MSQVLIRRHICEFLLKNKDHSSLFRSRLSSLSYSTSTSFNLIDPIKIRESESFTCKNDYLKKQTIFFLSNRLFLINHYNNSIQSHPRHHVRKFHSTSRLLFNDDSGNQNNDGNDAKNPNIDGQNETVVPITIPNMSPLAPLKVPDFLPKIPIVAISRNPLFPKFIKMIEVNYLYFLV
jgi:hypothetical protein